MIKRAIHWTYRSARRVAIAIVGGTVVLIGIALIVLPGPATVVIPAGLAILSLEFAWARRWLRKIRDTSKAAVDQVRGRNNRNNASPPDDAATG